MGTISEALARISAVADRCRDMTPVTRVIAADLKAFVDSRFQSSTSALDGSPFRPLSDATKSISRRRQGGTPLLDTGRLRSSVFARGTPTGVVFGTNSIQAKTQQFGRADNLVFGRAPGPIPARPFLPVLRDGSFGNAELLRRFQEMVRHWLETGEFL